MKMPSVMRGASRFAKVPQVNTPRSSFNLSHGHKTTFDIGYLIPVLCLEIYPGDSINCQMTAFARLSTPVKPLMDNLYLDSHFFFIPNRIVWENWIKFMGEQEDPGDSISYTVPQYNVPAAGYNAGSLADYFGIPLVGSSTTSWSHNALPFRGYYCVWNEWFRDENLQDKYSYTGSSGVSPNIGDGPSSPSVNIPVLKRGKRHDYFTSCLPWAQKGDASEATFAIESDGGAFKLEGNTSGAIGHIKPTASAADANANLMRSSGGASWTASEYTKYSDGLQVDVTINELREAIQIQKLLERDARSGTRYPEKIMAHFGVEDPGMLVMQRPEYLGGGSTPVMISPIAQTSASATAGAVDVDTEQGNLAGIGTAVARNHGFVKSFTEHGYVLGLVSTRCDLNYQDGLERHWSRSTQYDYYFPVFAGLGEQAVLNKEICLEDAATDDDAFGYQERWSELRYKPSRITGEFRSIHAQTLEVWHLAEDFSGGCPTLDETFIQVSPDLDRNLASTTNHHFLFDSYFNIVAARCLPMYSIPGNMDRF